MIFTYDSYKNMISLLKESDYGIASYKNWKTFKRCVILRHDIDNDLEKALELARVEKELSITSTYFVLVTSDFYNVFSSRSESLLNEISDCGHEIGLHFDEVRYHDILTSIDIKKHILEEAKILSKAIHRPISIVSMHRPSKMMLESDLDIPGMINSYGEVFFKEFKYLSDSRKRWREPIEEIITSHQYDRLHILTHAIWYNNDEISIHDSLYNFINAGNRQRYLFEGENITDIQSIMKESEVR